MVVLDEEAKHRLDFLEKQVREEARERAALKKQVQSYEELSQRRDADREAERLEQRGVAVRLAQSDELLRASREELRLEREMLAAARQQGDAAEAIHEADARQLETLKARLAARPKEAGSSAEHEDAAAWEQILSDKVAALEGALAARKSEAEGLRSQLDGARAELGRLGEHGPLQQARQEGAAAAEKLRAELVATQQRADAQAAEAAAASAAADAVRARVAEQDVWIKRRDAQLGSTRREVETLQGLLETANAAAAAERKAAEAAKAAAAASAKGSGSAPEPRALEAAISEGEELRRQLRAEGEAAAERLAEERAAVQRGDAEITALQAALAAEQGKAAEGAAALRELGERHTALQSEERAKGLEVSRLAQEVGAMQARLQASAQQARSADEILNNVRQQREIGEREAQRTKDGAELSELMVTQLKEALASESRRVASAWKAKEQLREAMQSRDEQLVALNAELFTVKADLDARDEQMAQLQEAQRLGTILVEGAEERSALKHAALLELQKEAEATQLELAQARAKLEALRDHELKVKEAALARASEQVESQQSASDGMEKRVSLLNAELEAQRAEALQLRADVAAKAEAERSLREGELRRASDELLAARSSQRVLALEKAELADALGRAQRKVERSSKELLARVEQLQVTHEAHRLLELEVTLKDERLRGVEETLATERARHAREAGVIKLLEQRNEEAAEAATRHSAELARERERNNLYEARLAEREEMMATAMEEVRAAELRGETREARLALLGEKSRTQGDEVRLRDERLGLLHTRLQLAHEQLAAAKAEGKLVLADLGDKTAVAERERSGAAALRARLEVAEERVRTRDEQQAILTKRLVTAREGLQVQLAMIDEEVAAAKLGMDAKDMQLELMLEEASGRERQAHAFMASVTAKLQKAHSLMGAKDELLAALSAKLRRTVDGLRLLEAQRDELTAAAEAARRERDAAGGELATLAQRHELATADLATASEALDNYRETLVTAEVRMEADRTKVLELQDALRRMREEGVVAPGGGGGGTAPTAMALPPLDGTNSEVGASRVHFLYFLSSFLLLKTALSAQGQMGNVAAQDVFDEIVRNEVPLEEWPTYIFTRVYAAHGTNDQEIAALKAVAKHASRAVATGGGETGNTTESEV